MDHYLKPEGRLGFVITQTIFKTAGGEVFRNFRLNPQTPVGVQVVDDMVDLQPFEGASNWTSVLVCQKGRETRYPVSYTVWRKVKGKPFSTDATLEEVALSTRRLNYAATPVDAIDRTSHWITARPRALKASRKVLGKSAYEARAGLVTWADGVYWMEVLEKRPDGLLQVTNLHDQGKRKLHKVLTAVEPDLLYPFARWTDIGRWRANPSCYILLPHTKEGGWKPIEQSQMRVRYPKSYAYLSQFKSILLSRSGYKQLREGEAFYILSNTGPWLYAPFKVAWRSMDTRVEAVVLELVHDPFLGVRPIMHKNTIVFVAAEERDEAHYLCAILNSATTDFIARSYSVGKSFGSPHLLQQIAIPAYDPALPLHRRLAELSQRAHALAPIADRTGGTATTGLATIEREIDKAAATLWGITPSEMLDIKRSLDELG